MIARMVAPAIAIGIVFGIVRAILAAHGVASLNFFGDLDAFGMRAFNMFIATIVAIGVQVAAATVTTVAVCTIAGGSLRRNAGQTILAAVLVVVFGLIAAFFVIPTFALSLPAFAYLVLYAIPACLGAGRSAPEAFVESPLVAYRNPRATFGALLAILVALIVGGLIAAAVRSFPAGAFVLQYVVAQLGVAYAALVALRTYRQHAAPPEQPPLGAAGP